MAKSDKMVPQNQQAGAIVVGGEIPEYLRRQEGEGTQGLEGMERSDLKMPRLALCQSMTPQRKRDDPKYIPGLEEGQWFNTLTRTNFGENVIFVPLLWFKSRIRFDSLDNGGGLLCRSEDSRTGVGDPGGDCMKCPMQRFTVVNNKRSRPECNLFHNYVAIILPAEGMPKVDAMVVISFKSTGLDAATDLNALMQMRGAKAAYAGVYQLSSASDTNAAGQQYYVPVVKNHGWVSPQLLSFMEQAYQSVKEMKQMNKLKIDEFTAEDIQTSVEEQM